MALRVLLADESTTIRKVFQLSLQDYGVEVKSVHVGIDVIPVAEKFKPDIVFADILLQKKSGYDVCSELQATPGLSNIPSVLMWSGFLELDEDKFEACGALGHLEKPFDVKRLRQLIHDLVPKTKKQKLNNYLEFPKMPDFEDAAPAEARSQQEEPLLDLGGGTNPGQPMEEDVFSMENLQEASEFQELQLPVQDHRSDEKETPAFEIFDPSVDTEEDGESDNWVSQTLPQFRINENEEKIFDSHDVDVDHVLPEDPAFSAEGGTINLDEVPSPPTTDYVEVEDDGYELDIESNEEQLEKAAKGSLRSEGSAQSFQGLDEVQLEKIIRAQSKEVIESVVWKVVPEIATQMIERELKRLLAEVEPRA